jgi:hypothetical protein
MPYLMGAPGANGEIATVFDWINEIASNSMFRKRQCRFSAITCYIDYAALVQLARQIKQAIETNGGQLVEFHVLYDAGEWAKQRPDAETRTRNALRRILSLPNEHLTFEAVFAPGQLMHGKAYAVTTIGKGNQPPRTGVVITTSGNLTKPGLGNHGKRRNIELASGSAEPDDLAIFYQTFGLLRGRIVPEDRRLARYELLRAIRLLAAGDLYHEWSGDLSAEFRFSLKLTKKGKKEWSERGGAMTRRGYNMDADTISQVPAEIKRVLERRTRPIPRGFIRKYSVDTLLGRWIPKEISKLLQQRMDGTVERSITALKRATSDEKLKRMAKRFDKHVTDLVERKFVTAPLPSEESRNRRSTLGEKWAGKVQKLRTNELLLQLHHYRFSMLPDVLANLERPFIVILVRQLKESLEMKGMRGDLRRAMYDVVSGKHAGIDDFVRNMIPEAKKSLGLARR